ncbi:MAG: T9SS type A sorting domain-containing protein, partial [Bacteroidia bacterium]|nr:T9SS type A sorting domain-containing protein [Bacteroidia bacterium]
KYMNIWVCDIDGGSTLGFAYTPGSTGPADDGIVIDYNFFGTIGTVANPYDMGRTATHEVGHWFDLEHIWGDESACAADDLVADTPEQKAENYACPSYPQTTQSGGRCLTSDPSSMFMNYMDYTDDDCMNIFTLGQKTRMQAALNTQRSGLITSNGCSGGVGINSVNTILPLSIFPNPSSGIFEMNLGMVESKVEIRITDLVGKSVFEKTFLPAENLSFDISHLPNGVYFAIISSNGKQATRKIAKN